MLGWLIVIRALTPEQVDRAQGKEEILAQWEIGLGGLTWLDKLVDLGKAVPLSQGGYPSRYTAKASDVLPFIIDGPPGHTGPAVVGDDYALPPNWKGNFQIHKDRAARCAPDQPLTIDAWDQS